MFIQKEGVKTFPDNDNTSNVFPTQWGVSEDMASIC